MNEFYEDEDCEIDQNILRKIVLFSYDQFKKCNSGITKSAIIQNIIKEIKKEVK